MNVLEQIQTEARQAETDALASYRAILARVESPKPTDKVTLQRLLATLGLSVDELTADVAVMKQAAALEAEKAAAAQREQSALDAQPAAQDAYKAAQGAVRAAQQLEADTLAAMTATVQARSNAATFVQQATEALAELHRTNPRLFA